eukprot:Em0256g3a
MVDYEGFMKEEEDEDIQVWNENENRELVLSDQLSGPQRKQLFQLLKEFKDNLGQIEADLECLCKAGLMAKPQKYQFGMAQCCVYLCHLVGSEIVELDPNKGRVPCTKDQEGVYMLPVRMATRFKECEDAFLRLKVILCGSPVLRSPEYEKEFIPQVPLM